MTVTRIRSRRYVRAVCPICHGRGRRDAPQCRLLDATCEQCGWHYSSRPCVLRLAGASLEVGR